MVAIKNFKEYEIDELGRIYSLRRKKYLKTTIQKSGYEYVRLCVNYKKQSFMVHRLVAETFIPNLENKSCVNHKNGIKTDNHIDNLEWVSYSENMQHAYNNTLIQNKYGGNHHNSKKVSQYDKKGLLIKIWDSTIEAANNNLNVARCIQRVCRNERKTFNKFIWKYN